MSWGHGDHILSVQRDIRRTLSTERPKLKVAQDAPDTDHSKIYGTVTI